MKSITPPDVDGYVMAWYAWSGIAGLDKRLMGGIVKVWKDRIEIPLPDSGQFEFSIAGDQVLTHPPMQEILRPIENPHVIELLCEQIVGGQELVRHGELDIEVNIPNAPYPN